MVLTQFAQQFVSTVTTPLLVSCVVWSHYSTCPPIYLNSQPITIVNSDKHLGNLFPSDIQDRNVISSVCDLYQRSNSIISDFSSCNSVSLDKFAHYIMYAYVWV